MHARKIRVRKRSRKPTIYHFNMKTFTFDFAVQAWVKGLEIEAETYEEAEEELLSMSLEKIVDKGY